MASDSVRGLIRQLIQGGLDSTEGLDHFRSRGGGIEDDAWHRAWGETFAALDRTEQVAAAALNRTPDAAEIVDRNTRVSRGYLYRVAVDVEDKATGATIRIHHSVRTRQPIRYGTALARALDDYEQGAAQYEQTVLGGRVTAVYRMTPTGR